MTIHDPGASPARNWNVHAEKIKRGILAPTLRIGLAASVTVDTLVPFLGGSLLEAGELPAITLGPYNQLFQVCLEPGAYFPDTPDILILLWRMEESIGGEMEAFLRGEEQALSQALEKVDFFVSALSTLRSHFFGTLIVSTPPFPSALPLDPAGPCPAPSQSAGTLHREVTARFLEKLRPLSGISLFDLDAAQRDFGTAAAFDARHWYLYRQPYSHAFLRQTGALLARSVLATRRAPKKCVVLDCDNTLWGGIVGEDGLEGITLGEEFPGSAYRDFQKLILFWKKQGVLLALASKNNEADVWEVFSRHTGMVLRREDIAAWQINWTPKSQNIPALAQALNIGIDSLVFIDDNPIEIEAMKAAHPEVSSILLPEEPAEIVSTLCRLPLFDRLSVTREDRERTTLMQAERQRQHLGEMSPEDFRQALGLRLELFRARPEELERITQLINKTNQFNLTTIRRSFDEVRALAASPAHRVYGLRVADRFGDYGLTGAAVVEIASPQTWKLDTFLLSCRVLGRGVETALLAALTEEARKEGGKKWVASFVATPKNTPAASFLPQHGFQAMDGDRWWIALENVPPLPGSITLDSGQPLSE